MELILAFVLAHMFMKAKGENSAFAPGAGSAPGAGRVANWARGGVQRGVNRPAGGNRSVRSGPAGIADRFANWRDRATAAARRGAERQYDRIEHDKGAHRRLHGDGDDPRSRWQRIQDQRRTCPECGHGGLVGYRHDCTCTGRGCRCRHQVAPYWGSTPRRDEDPRPTPQPLVDTPAGRDGPAASDDPTRPEPTTPGPAEEPEGSTSTDERTDPVTAPVSPTRPSAPSAPSAPVSPGAKPGGASGGGGSTALQNLPPLDPSDIRLYEARRHLNAYAANATVISEGLRGQDVDSQTTGKIADMAAQLNALVSEMNRIYGPVEQAINESRHVAKREAYQHR